MNPVIHFEMPYKDQKKLIEFYSKVFNWKMTTTGNEFANYVLAMTTDSDDKGPLKPGAINGGFFEKDANKPDQIPSVVIEVEDINAYIQLIKEAGGEVLGEPVEIPQIGKYVSFRDTEGNRVSLLQPPKK